MMKGELTPVGMCAMSAMKSPPSKRLELAMRTLLRFWPLPRFDVESTFMYATPLETYASLLFLASDSET